MPSWTNPRTWVIAETATAAQLNTHLRDNLDFLHTKDRVHVYRTANENCVDSTWELNNWTAEVFDNNTMHDNATNNSRLKCNSDGVYLVEFKINFVAETAGQRKVMLRRNSGGSDTGGTDQGTWTEDGIVTSATTVAGARLIALNNTDYIETFSWQSSGSPLDISSGAEVTFVQMMQLAG